MAYARTEKAPERPFPLGQCADGVNCNKYYTRTIHYEEPFNGISEGTHRIGIQDVATQPKYVPTSIYPTAGPKTGFAQQKTAPQPVTTKPAVIENVKKLDFPGSKQGMPYARTDPVEKPGF